MKRQEGKEKIQAELERKITDNDGGAAIIFFWAADKFLCDWARVKISA